MRPRVVLETLGCKLNQYETEAIAASFQDLGWDVVGADVAATEAEAPEAQAYVVNTCTVTNKADRKSRNAVGHHLGRPHNPIVVVTGCFAESARESLEGKEGVTFVVPNARKNQIAALVDARWKGEVHDPAPADPFAFPIHDKVFHTRASLKVQDGCDNFCSFCIIPQVRGRAVSRGYDSVLEAARSLVAAGRREIVLTGVNMGRWGDQGRTFTDLVAAVLALEGDFRVRITSLEPEGLGEAFADLFTHPKMCPHLHLCLQSASPRVLLAMRREYNLEQYAGLVALLRSRRPDLNLTTDLIVGFPGETDADYRLSLDAVEGFGFGHVHVFPYSRRQGTRAERMPDQVAEAEKSRRSLEVQGRSLAVRRKKMEALVGARRRVLVESPVGEWQRGLTEDYFPVRWKGTQPWNTFVEVTLSGIEGTDDPWFVGNPPEEASQRG